MARWRSRGIDRAIVGGLVLSLGFAVRARPHSLAISATAAMAALAAARLLGRPEAPSPPPVSPEPIVNGTLVSMVAHEIRAPLAAIRGAASLLDEYHDQLGADRRAELLRVSLDATQQLGRLVDDLLLVSRISGGRLRVERTEVDVAAVVRDAGHAEVGHEVSVVAQEGLPNVIGDPLRIRQIVTNLLANAIAHASERSVVIVSIARDGDCVRTTIFNEGTGIAPEEQSKLFLPFASLNERRIDSTGLGLYISKQLVEAMDGEIGFDTQPGHNAVFWFTLQASHAGTHAVEFEAGSAQSTHALRV